MTKLEKWTEAQGMVVFPRLEELHVQDCPELKTLCISNSQGRGSSITPFSALRKLTLSNMTKLEKWTEAEGMVVFHDLEELHIWDCPELKTWWASSSQGEGESILPFPALRKLTLSNMTKLEKWTGAQGMVLFPCLEELHVRDCPERKTFCTSNSQGRGAISRFSALRKLTLSNSRGRGAISPFPALRKLTLSNMTKLGKWTEAQDMAVFPCLEELHIWDCPKLKTWWEDGSASPNLSKLGIQSCPNLQAIPIRLLNLTSLDINNCPKLMGYAQEGSHKWLSICHTHRIRINGQMVQSRRS
ncbi:hypothetical protein SLEP1_g20152 [Rubroshorea leprosula]|uniref:Disease resistance protein At4g27190-like leucine-rich repeats domain-containing protein n=1 Tax=Rubroshorea leprosula TaxID=152421 RepID=A0AAV5JAX9_9ROSI|nr:hypothetical protein SLEP1_g20152 [Rubroshorea leprosula]